MRVNPHTLLNVWIYFNLIVNTILLPILVATFLFSKKVKRHLTLVNLCITWILSGIFSLLLFYAGQYDTREPSNHSLCIVQSSLFFGITPMWTIAVFAMIFHMMVTINGSEVGPWTMDLMLASPYVSQIVFSTANLIVSVRHPEKVTRQHKFLYCALRDDLLTYVACGFTAVVCAGIVLLEISFARALFRHWRASKKKRNATQFNAQLFIRISIFCTYIFFGVIVIFIDTFDESSFAPDIYNTTIGIVLVLIFGTQPDVFRAWCFWRKEKPRPMIYMPPSEYDVGSKSGPWSPILSVAAFPRPPTQAFLRPKSASYGSFFNNRFN